MIGKIILGDALKITGNVLRTTGDVAGSIVNAGGNFIDRASDIGQLGKKKIKGKVILIRSNVLNITEFHSSILDGFTELLGSGIVMQLVSATEIDSHSNERQGKVGRRAYLEKWLTSFPPIFAEESVFEINFEWEDDFGYPGAFYIRNGHTSEFFLKSLTLEDVPNYGKVHFDCNSWVYPQRRYNKDRIFFANKTYLPNETPKALRKYREEELLNLRGDGKGEHQEWDRIYDYDVYNDIADPDAGHQFVRPILGGSTSYPYPRRGRTGRPRSRRDVNYEERLKSVIKSIYVPRDESIFGKKISEIFAYQLKSIAQSLQHKFGVLFNRYPKEFGSFKDVLKLYNGGFPLPTHFLSTLGSFVKEPFLKELLRTDGEQLLKFPLPQLIQDNYSGWKTDEEFAREMLAGANPAVICGLQEFPPSSKLDPNIYGDQKSKITEEHIMNNLDGFTVNEAMKQNKLYILDHHDYVIPFLRRINTTSSTKIYATRTILFLKKDGTLKPLAIELSLPHPQHNKYGVISRVLLPATKGVAASLWQLAKAYVAINDNGHHQLISHWCLGDHFGVCYVNNFCIIRAMMVFK
uniref:Uncharacterized protein n=1 Tax=Cucumis melo TaxID=3656 RepID=A0A1S4E045_CUCME